MMDWKLTRVMLPLVLVASACSGDKSKSGTDSDTGTDTDTDTGTTTGGCQVTISLDNPASTALSSVYYRSPIVISFSAQEQGKVSTDFATLKDGSGNSVNLGTPTWDSTGKQVTFDDHDALTPSTAYTLTVNASETGCTNSFSLTTSDVGAALSDPTSVLNKTYAVNIADPGVQILQPAGVGGLLGSLLGQLNGLSIDIVPNDYDADAKTLTFYGGVVQDGTQNMCTPTLDFSDHPADFSQNPFFQLDASTGITITYSGYSIPIDSLKLGGSFTADASSIVGITLDGQVDARKLGSLVGGLLGQQADTSSPDAGVCTLIGSLGVSCEACPSDNQPYCLHLVAVNIPAPVATTPLVEVTQDDIDTDAACDTDTTAN